MKKLIRENIEQANRLGWSPEDFGVTGFGPELVEAIKGFQSERFLSETGVVDWRTFKALDTYQKQLQDTEHQRQRERGLLHLASTEGYDPERVARTNEFVAVDFSDGAGMVVDWRDTLSTDRPLVVSVDTYEFSEFLSSLDDLNLGTAPRAIMTTVSPVDMSKEDRKSWKRVGDLFDAACPIVPGLLSGSPIEYVIGQVVSQWSIFAKIRPTFCLPVYSGDSVEELHRLRRWCKRRMIRGVSFLTGYGSSLGSELRQAWSGPIEDVDRVDYI